MTRPNTSPLQRTQKCVCGESHPVILTLMGAPVVECKYAPGPALHLEQTTDFPLVWFLRMEPPMRAGEELIERAKARPRPKNRPGD